MVSSFRLVAVELACDRAPVVHIKYCCLGIFGWNLRVRPDRGSLGISLKFIGLDRRSAHASTPAGLRGKMTLVLSRRADGTDRCMQRAIFIWACGQAEIDVVG
jgi:hypothetical protein